MKARLAALPAACLLAAGLLVATPATSRAAAVPGTGCNVFPANNIWNTDISSMPVNSHSAAWLASTGAGSGRLLHPDFGGPPYGIPFNVVDSSHPAGTFTFQYASESDPGAYPYGGDLLIEQGSDAHMLTINQSTCMLYETFATNSSGPRTAGSGAIFDLSSNALRPDTWTSADAAGLPIFPGLVRLDEVQAGFIGHAIRFTVQQSDRSYLWPARHQAGSASDPNLPPMGARFRLKSTYDISGFGAAAQVVLTAMKTYGLIVADNGSNWYFQGTEDAGWDSGPYPAMIAQLKTIPASQFEAVDESSLMVDPNSALAGVPQAPTGVSAGSGLDRSSLVSWTAPANHGSSAITSYTVTASDGCTVQATMTVAAPATSATFTGLENGNAYTFTVAAVNGYGTGPPSAPSAVAVPAGSATWSTRCSARQYRLAGGNGTTWTDMDPTNLALGFTAPVSSWALITANSDLFTGSAGYNQDIGIAVGGGAYPSTAGRPEAWKESGGFGGTLSPNAASVQVALPVAAGTPYTVSLQWKANRSGPGAIYAGAGPILGTYSPTRITVQLVDAAAGRVFAARTVSQLHLSRSDGATWRDMDAANLSLDVVPPSGTWAAYVTGNADLFTASTGYNQDIGIAVSGGTYPTTAGQPEAWKESGGFAGTFSPNAAFVQAALPATLVGGTHYTVKLQWKTNRADPGTIWAGAGPLDPGSYSPTTLTVLLVPSTVAAASSTAQHGYPSSDGATWRVMDGASLEWTLAPGADGDYAISAGTDLWTSVAGYNQDLGIMLSGGVYGAGTLVAWKESGGFAGTYSPNAAFVTSDLHLLGGTSYSAWIVWKANRRATRPNSIWSGAGPVGGRYSPATLIALQLG